MKKMIVLTGLAGIAFGIAYQKFQGPTAERQFVASCETDLVAKDKGASLRQISKVFKVTDCKKIHQLVASQRSLDLASVVEVESIKAFTTLETLNLDLFHEVDLSALKDLKQLKHLKVTANFGRVPARGLKTLVQNLPKLESLSLGGLDLLPEDSGFADGSSVQRLELSEVNIQSLSSLGSLPKVTRLAIPFSLLQDLQGIESYKNLHELVISGTRVEDLKPLTQLAQLEFLDISLTPVKNLQPLAQLTQLKRIQFDRGEESMQPGSVVPLECPSGQMPEALKDICQPS